VLLKPFGRVKQPIDVKALNALLGKLGAKDTARRKRRK
jgi:hypothetical protein